MGVDVSFVTNAFDAIYSKMAQSIDIQEVYLLCSKLNVVLILIDA